jgi:hypothetical protein
MRTTVNIDEHLLAEAKLIAARSHRTIGSVLEDGLRKLLDEQTPQPSGKRYRLPRFPTGGGLRPGIDLYDKDQIEALLDDGKHHAF